MVTLTFSLSCSSVGRSLASRDHGTSSSSVVADCPSGAVRHVSDRRGSHTGDHGMCVVISCFRFNPWTNSLFLVFIGHIDLLRYPLEPLVSIKHRLPQLQARHRTIGYGCRAVAKRSSLKAPASAPLQQESCSLTSREFLYHLLY
jgi:hypothetical protein